MSDENVSKHPTLMGPTGLQKPITRIEVENVLKSAPRTHKNSAVYFYCLDLIAHYIGHLRSSDEQVIRAVTELEQKLRVMLAPKNILNTHELTWLIGSYLQYFS
jgi:hypothetical protein